VADILATDGAARAELGAGLAAGRFTDEVRIVAELDRPLAMLHGAEDQLVNLDYLQAQQVPTLWRDSVRIIERAGHAVQEESPRRLADLLTGFIAE
jgi:pimeloyl-ACP methyl ester carboxylesterase